MTHASRKRYRPIAASLGPQELAVADGITTRLQDVGWPHSNRSLVVREAVLLLGDTLHGKSADELFRFFIERQRSRARRPRPPSAT